MMGRWGEGGRSIRKETGSEGEKEAMEGDGTGQTDIWKHVGFILAQVAHVRMLACLPVDVKEMRMRSCSALAWRN